MKLLHLDSSALGANSVSRQLGAAVVESWRQASSGLEVLYHDLDAQPVPHLTAKALAREDAFAAARADTVLQEFLDADVVVVGVPFYNFGIPSTLKAWIDRIAVAGKTFRYTEAGPMGMATGKRVVLAISSGGVHAGTERDFTEPYLRTVFGFLGIDDIQVVRAEGIGISPQVREAAIAAAISTIGQPLQIAA